MLNFIKQAIFVFCTLIALTNCQKTQFGQRGKSVGKFQTIAHRGFWKTEGSAQNSLASLRKAQELGCYGSEFDVWLTTDGKLVLNHDGVIDGIRIENAAYSEIKDKTLTNGETIPTLEDCLQQGKLRPETRLIIEIKTHSTEEQNNRAVAAALKAVAAAEMNNQVEYIAFSLDVCLEIIRLQPGAKVAYLNGDKKPQELKPLNITGIDYNIGVLRRHREYVKQAHELGLTVNVWTVSSVEDIKEMAEIGVDYITTDNPAASISLQ
jgi:glycerophosphoryl diester phosphodiesterase